MALWERLEKEKAEMSTLKEENERLRCIGTESRRNSGRSTGAGSAVSVKSTAQPTIINRKYVMYILKEKKGMAFIGCSGLSFYQ